MSDFRHFHSLTGHRLSVHIPAAPNMVKERVSSKFFAPLRKNGCFGPELNEAQIDAPVEELLILEFLIKQ